MGGMPVDATWDQDSWRWRNDDGNETTATWIAATNVEPTTLGLDTAYRIRFLTQETAGSNQNEYCNVELQYRINQGSGFGSWTDVPIDTDTSLPVRASSPTGVGTVSTQQIGAGTFVGGELQRGDLVAGRVVHTTSGNDEYEHEFGVYFNSSATTPAAADDIVEFRLLVTDGNQNTKDLYTANGGSYTRTPSITIASAAGASVGESDGTSTAQAFSASTLSADGAATATSFSGSTAVGAGQGTATAVGALSAVWDQDSFRFRHDDGSEITATWAAAANVDIPIKIDTIYRCRILVQDTNGSQSAEAPQFRVQRSINGGGWGALAVQGTDNRYRHALSANFADNDPTTQQLGSGTFIDGRMLENNSLSAVNASVTPNGEYEIEFSFEANSGATVPATYGDTLDLRLRINTGGGEKDLDTYTNIGRITVAAGDAVAAGTATAQAFTGSVAEAAGVATAQAVGLVPVVAEAAGTSTAAAFSASIAESSAAATAAALSGAIGESAGVATANALTGSEALASGLATSAAFTGSILEAAGVATVEGIAEAAPSGSVAASSGTSTAVAFSGSTGAATAAATAQAETGSVASSSGVATATGRAAVFAVASAGATVAGFAGSTAASVGLAASTAFSGSILTSNGIATVTGISTSGNIGESSGTSTATAFSGSIAIGVAASSAQAETGSVGASAGVGASDGRSGSVAAASGLSTADAQTGSVARAAASSIVLGESIVTMTASAAGVSTATAFSGSQMNANGSAIVDGRSEIVGPVTGGAGTIHLSIGLNI